ncbi:acyltransferase family protein [Brevibacterium spongiae]|uniref:Acyltransferase n=1 Tax=Brevibacterium spongiae TaxID=2909672 RepID=A0ABY5SSI5_9MICO|nr:acyltransferase [Brevibacterium spongiae]UVI37154.1 acyltransferase [Brevibacterium spongiae]
MTTSIPRHRDLTLDLARVVCVLVVVFVHLVLVGAGRNPDGSPFIINPVSGQRWFAPATWIAEIMPMFFVVGGFAARVGWDSAQRRGESASTFVRTRLRRLALPALPLFVVLTLALVSIRFLGVDPELADAVAVPVGSVLWFLAAYALVQSLAPWMIRWHEHNPWLALVVLFAGAFFVDVVRLVVGIQGLGLDRISADGYGIGDELFGLPNVAFVWLFAQQIGFCLRDGWFSRVRWWNLVLIVAGFACLGLLVILGEYSASMLTNQWPPTLPLAVLAIIQAALLALLHRPLTAIMDRRWAQGIVFFLGSRLMSMYLWHVPAIVVLTGIQLLWLPMPDPGTAAWWLSRPLFVIAVLLVVWAISTGTKRWESPPPVLSPRLPSAAATFAAVCVFIVQSLAISTYGLDLPLAVLGLVCTAVAVWLTGPSATTSRRSAPVPPAEAMPSSPR